MDSNKRLTESEGEYLKRLKRESDEETIEHLSGNAPSQGITESDLDYQRRIDREANEETIKNGSGSIPRKNLFENDSEYQRRVEREANEETIKRESGSTPSKNWWESDSDYQKRVDREADEETIKSGSGSKPSKNWWESDSDYQKRIFEDAASIKSRRRNEEDSSGGSGGGGGEYSGWIAFFLAVLAFAALLTFWIFKKIGPLLGDLWNRYALKKNQRSFGDIVLSNKAASAIVGFIILYGGAVTIGNLFDDISAHFRNTPPQTSENQTPITNNVSTVPAMQIATPTVNVMVSNINKPVVRKTHKKHIIKQVATIDNAPLNLNGTFWCQGFNGAITPKMIWQLIQTGTDITGRFFAVDSVENMLYSGTISGTLNGRNLNYTISFPAGVSTATPVDGIISGVATDVTNTTIKTKYTLKDSNGYSYTSGLTSLNIASDPNFLTKVCINCIPNR